MNIYEYQWISMNTYISIYIYIYTYIYIYMNINEYQGLTMIINEYQPSRWAVGSRDPKSSRHPSAFHPQTSRSGQGVSFGMAGVGSWCGKGLLWSPGFVSATDLQTLLLYIYIYTLYIYIYKY